MKTLISALGALMLLGAGAASAANAPTPDCNNATTQTDMAICAGKALREADTALNRNYGVVMARLSPDGKKALRDAQRAWLVFRDKQCFFESNGKDGGSIAPLTARNCAQRLTDQRAKALAAFKTCEEGDTSCPR